MDLLKIGKKVDENKSTKTNRRKQSRRKQVHGNKVDENKVDETKLFKWSFAVDVCHLVEGLEKILALRTELGSYDLRIRFKT